MADFKQVWVGEIHVPLVINEWLIDGETRYDYYDSFELYDSIEEAVRAAANQHDGYAVEGSGE